MSSECIYGRESFGIEPAVLQPDTSEKGKAWINNTCESDTASECPFAKVYSGSIN